MGLSGLNDANLTDDFPWSPFRGEPMSKLINKPY